MIPMENYRCLQKKNNGEPPLAESFRSFVLARLERDRSHPLGLCTSARSSRASLRGGQVGESRLQAEGWSRTRWHIQERTTTIQIAEHLLFAP